MTLVPLDAFPSTSTFLGRILSIQVDADGDFIVLDDGAIAKKFRLPSIEPKHPTFSPGDWVCVYFLPQSPSQALSVDLLQPSYRARQGEHFPFVDGEWYRFHKNDRNRYKNIKQRSLLLGQIRQFFDERDFTEIEAPLMVPSPGLELHLQAMKLEQHERYLITSPEY